MSRFFNLSYVWHTLGIKVRALALKLTRGVYPFDYYKDKTTDFEVSAMVLKYHDNYHSLAYLDYQKAELLHTGNRSVTQDLIVGLAFYNDFIKDNDLDRDYLVDLSMKLKERADFSEDGMIFYFDEPYVKFDLKGKYSSGIVQGKAASYFLRCYLLTKDDKYKEWAKKCLLSSWQSIDNGGNLRKLPNDHSWIEEYPSPKPSMVLNGFLFYIIGLIEYLTIEEDAEMRLKLDACLNTVLTWTPKFRLKNGLLYSMYRWNLCNVHYTGIMKFQFEHLFMLTGIAVFRDYAKFCDELTDWDTFNKIV